MDEEAKLESLADVFKDHSVQVLRRALKNAGGNLQAATIALLSVDPIAEEKVDE